MNREILKKFLSNNCTSTELSELLNWIKTDVLNEESKLWIFDDWKSYQNGTDLEEDEEKYTAIFDRIQHKINSSEQQEKISTNKVIKISTLQSWVTKAAAIVLIPVLGLLFYTLSLRKTESDKYAKLAVDSIEVIAPLGSRTVLQLSDGSVVHLNYGSKLKYPQFFAGDTRNVTLTGEGFFEVSHDPKKPFIVKTGNLHVKAVGTTFNVLAYPEDNEIEATLVSGKIIIDQITKNGKSKTISTLTPGQHIDYHKLTNVISSTTGNIEKYISWASGKLIFEDTPIQQVLGRLSRMFNVDFVVKDEIRDYTYTVTFVDESLSQILDLITIATPVAYKTLPRKKLPDGTFTRQKIIIENRK